MGGVQGYPSGPNPTSRVPNYDRKKLSKKFIEKNYRKKIIEKKLSKKNYQKKYHRAKMILSKNICRINCFTKKNKKNQNH